MSGLPPAAVAAAFLAACRAELDALKPGNVHAHAPGHGMTVADFVSSAEAAAPFISDPARGVGGRVLGAVEATRAACGQNTNLGILLLAAPLAAAAQAGGELRSTLKRVLAELTVDDASLAYRAIRLASPGGLGRSDRHDVAAEPAVTLLQAMRAAAARDRIAHQYATGFADVLDVGVPRLLACRARGWGEGWAVAATYLAFLAGFADTHVARRHGEAAAEAVCRRAAELERHLMAGDDPEALLPALLAFDGDLKRAGLNPGTSADLTVASWFAESLQSAAKCLLR
jgi:triphosphoribosyl-dephospho-CoA synthase